MNLDTELTSVSCPYCGENFDAIIDPSAGNHEYVEDCYVCCQPIVFSVLVDGDGVIISTRTENE